jgi:hypothetical protein
VNTLFEPDFEYPDLVGVAEAMIAGTISMKDAIVLARKVTGGEVRNTSVGRAIVIGPKEGAVKTLADLQAYANAHDQQTVERWAAFALMIEAQLGVVNLDPEAAPVALGNALRGFEPCVRATGARCPPEAVGFALQVVDSILRNPACTDPTLRGRLDAARNSFRACAENPSRGLLGWFKSLFRVH